MDEIEKAIEEQRSWLRQQLAVAATKLDVEVQGDIVHTYDVRSAGSRARDGDTDVWLRVVFENPVYQPACRWEGNVEANAISGVPKPTVVRWQDWTNTEPLRRGCRMRGEVMTLAPGATIAPDGQLHCDPGLPETWWMDLHDALGNLAQHPAPEAAPLDTVGYTSDGVVEFFGVTLPPSRFDGIRWVTAHADLHWGNVTGPELCILDWESWRSAPAGYDAATLYCNSLRTPKTADMIRLLFDNVFDTTSGSLALLYAVVRYLRLVGEGGDWDDLGEPLRKVGWQAIEALRA
jgi:hypothetical protein